VHGAPIGGGGREGVLERYHARVLGMYEALAQRCARTEAAHAAQRALVPQVRAASLPALGLGRRARSCLGTAPQCVSLLGPCARSN
jgi:hypothetical protein